MLHESVRYYQAVYVLSSKRQYSLPREAIARHLLAIINLPGIKLPNKRLYACVFDLCVSLPIDFIDCYHAALIENRHDPALCSFHRDFDRIPSIRTIEPREDTEIR